MVRAILTAAAFFAITLALILAQPGKTPPDIQTAAAEDNDVTRSGPDLSSIEVAQEIPAPDAGAQERLAQQPVLPDTPALATRPAVAAPEGVVQSGNGVVHSAPPRRPTEASARAATSGQVIDPAALHSLVSDDGQIDTALLLDTLSAPATASIPEVYTVKRGDSLATIAFRFYQDITREADIRAANADTLDASGRVRVGQELVLPQR